MVVSQQVPVMTTHGIFYTSMFGTHRPFQINTCEKLIVRFGQGSLFLNFEQFSSLMVFLKEMKAAFCRLDTSAKGSLNLQELCNALAQAGVTFPEQLALQIGRHFDTDNSGAIEFDEFLQLAAEWQEMWNLQGSFGSTIGAAELQQLMGSVRVFYQVINGAVQTVRPFSLNTCRWLIAKFGSPQVGERFAQRISYHQFLQLVQYLKECYYRFMQTDRDGTGSIERYELGAQFMSCGLNLSADAVENIGLSYDFDKSGRLTFDEFIQMLVEVQLYDTCFTAREQNPAILTPLNAFNPILGQSLASSTPGPGLVTLDRSAFFAMVFAVPRNLDLST